MTLLPSFSLSSLTLAVALTMAVPACQPRSHDDITPTPSPWPSPTPTPPPAPAPTDADLFTTSTLHDVSLTMAATDLALLREHYGENTFYSANLAWRDVTVPNVAIRSRGFDSRDPTKLGIYIDVDRYTRGQRFLGLRTLVLDNMRQDPAMMRESLASAIFERMGQPISRVAFCRLYINGDYQGLYEVIENLDSAFIDRVFGHDDGYLFEYQMLNRFDGQYLGDDLRPWKIMFEARTNGSEPDDVLYEPIRALFEAINAPEDVKGRADIERYMDLPQYVRFLAIERAMTDLDGLVGQWGMNNFYLYRDPGSTPHVFLPWDRDRSLVPELLTSSILDWVRENAVSRRALSYPDLYALYLDAADNTARTMIDHDWLPGEIDRLWALIQQAAYEDTRKPYSNTDVDNAIGWLRQIARERPARVRDEVAALRGAAQGVR